MIVLWAHVPALFTFAMVRGFGWQHAVVEAGLVAIPTFVAFLAENRRRFSTVVASVGLMTASAVLVHLSGGVIEAHFHFFVMVGVVVLYQEWIPYLVAIGYVVLHHTVMGSLYPSAVYSHGSAQEHPIQWAVIHGVAILAMSAAGIANWRINEKHQSELNALNAMLEATLESTADGILVVAPNGQITSSNSRFAEMYRLQNSNLLLGDDRALVAHMEDQLCEPEAYVARVEELYADPASESHDTLVFKDGRVLERSSKPQRVDGEVVGRVWTFHDVTNRKRLEDELADALRKALESSRLKSEFLATMSHEIRTPMNGIIGLTALLLDTELEGLQRQYVDGVHSSGEALLTIVNDVLDFSKIEAGRLELETVDFDVLPALEDVIALETLPARRKNLELTLDASDNATKRMRGDVGRLRQIVLNLVSNAVKFTESGGVTVRFSTKPRLHSSFDDDGGVMLHVEVEDTGVGIAEDDRARLFEPFTQVDSSTTRRYGGTGLGLAICARLAAEMGGSVDVASRVGVGSMFMLDIPFDFPESQSNGSDARTPRRGDPAATATSPGAFLLIVEDNVVNQLVMKEMVRHLGYRCDVAANGVEALASLKRRQYSAVVMDCYMPEMDGFDATAELRRQEGDQSHTPVIALTAGVLPADRERCEAAGMDDYLTKPVNAAQLASTLNRWVAA
jgi:PAS domain S-box-containing protein